MRSRASAGGLFRLILLFGGLRFFLLFDRRLPVHVLVAVLEDGLAEGLHAVRIVPEHVVGVREVDADVRDVVLFQRLREFVRGK